MTTFILSIIAGFAFFFILGTFFHLRTPQQMGIEELAKRCDILGAESFLLFISAQLLIFCSLILVFAKVEISPLFLLLPILQIVSTFLNRRLRTKTKTALAHALDAIKIIEWRIPSTDGKSILKLFLTKSPENKHPVSRLYLQTWQENATENPRAVTPKEFKALLKYQTGILQDLEPKIREGLPKTDLLPLRQKLQEQEVTHIIDIEGLEELPQEFSPFQEHLEAIFHAKA